MIELIVDYILNIDRLCIPTNTPRVFRFETTWKRSFPCRFKVEYTCCVCKINFSSVFVYFFCSLQWFVKQMPIMSYEKVTEEK